MPSWAQASRLRTGGSTILRLRSKKSQDGFSTSKRSFLRRTRSVQPGDRLDASSRVSPIARLAGSPWIWPILAVSLCVTSFLAKHRDAPIAFCAEPCPPAPTPPRSLRRRRMRTSWYHRGTGCILQCVQYVTRRGRGGRRGRATDGSTLVVRGSNPGAPIALPPLRERRRAS
jgi:hypothetical protein